MIWRLLFNYNAVVLNQNLWHFCRVLCLNFLLNPAFNYNGASFFRREMDMLRNHTKSSLNSRVYNNKATRMCSIFLRTDILGVFNA